MAEAMQKEILTELKAIREDLTYIKKHIIDADAILTGEDRAALRAAEEDLKEGRTKRL